MSTTYFLAADHHALDFEFLRELCFGSRPPSGTACYIGAAHDDDRRWAKKSVDRMRAALGIDCVAPRLSDESLDVVEARAAIESARILFLDGGDTVGLVEHARARGLFDAFAIASQRGAVISGVSAGACAVAPFTIGYDDDEKGIVAPCFAMGFPAPLDAHSEDDDWSEMRALLELLRTQTSLPQEGIVMPTKAALVRTPDGACYSRGKVLCERRRLNKDGTWIVEPIAAR